jgi:XTP/dITP diphosphohydrolase
LIATEARGDQGFGYDPIFYVTETNCHAAELDKVTKNRLSHRGKAIANLLQQLQTR